MIGLGLRRALLSPVKRQGVVVKRMASGSSRTGDLELMAVYGITAVAVGGVVYNAFEYIPRTISTIRKYYKYEKDLPRTDVWQPK